MIRSLKPHHLYMRITNRRNNIQLWFTTEAQQNRHLFPRFPRMDGGNTYIVHSCQTCELYEIFVVRMDAYLLGCDGERDYVGASNVVRIFHLE